MLDREHYDRFRVSPLDPATLRVGAVAGTLNAVAASAQGRLRLEKFAESFEGRPIYLATLGAGPRRVLLWSQMHGDEPTHTAVLLDMLSYLTRSPAEPLAADILANCTLYMVPMLNPDGAERASRFNAQGIDVNRDARRLATPEGRALRRAVETIRPEFAFNLHNQNARTADGNPPKSVVASLLAPPPDEKHTETDPVRRAKQIAACFADAVRPDVDHVDGVVSRYDDKFEPRAFGDTIQAMGTATVLVEAGGWPETDPEPIVRLHFQGMLAALHAIATRSYRHADVAIYESLPRSNSNKLFDCLVTGGQVLDARTGHVFRADLGINHSHGERLTRSAKPDGRIADVGDLDAAAGKLAIDASGCLVLPGRIAYLPDFAPGALLEPKRLELLLATGVTTIVGPANRAGGDAPGARAPQPEWPGNLAFALRQPAAAAPATPHGASYTYADLARQTWQHHELFGLQTNRGHIDRECFADLLFFDLGETIDVSRTVDWQRLKRVMVAGDTAWLDGQRTGRDAGALLPDSAPTVHVR